MNSTSLPLPAALDLLGNWMGVVYAGLYHENFIRENSEFGQTAKYLILENFGLYSISCRNLQNSV
jgi:hypothetical protein